MAPSTRAATLALLACVAGCRSAPNPQDAALQNYADRQAIETTLVRYSTGLDTFDADVYASVFTEDAEFTMENKVYRGREEIRGIITGMKAGRAARQADADPANDPPPIMHHVMTNAVIRHHWTGYGPPSLLLDDGVRRAGNVQLPRGRRRSLRRRARQAQWPVADPSPQDRGIGPRPGQARQKQQRRYDGAVKSDLRLPFTGLRFALAMVLLCSATSQAQERALSFTIAQASAGQAAYVANCVTCHGPQLNGPLGKPLEGPSSCRSTAERVPPSCSRALRTTMPTGRAGSLDLATYAALTAFLLRENAIVRVTCRCRPTHGVSKMLVPASGFSLIGYSPYAPLKMATLPDPLNGFTPVTHKDLAAPPAKDWLTWRRGWDAHGSVRWPDLGLERRPSSPRVELTLPPGSSQAAPLVRDGTLFVEGFGDIVQAIDAKSGDLLWQYSPPLEQGAAPFAKRGIALWGDRLYFGTSDVHVVALTCTPARSCGIRVSATSGFARDSPAGRWWPLAGC